MYVECLFPDCDWRCDSFSDVCVLDFVFLHGPESEHPIADLFDDRGNFMRRLDADFCWHEHKITWRTLPCDEVPDPEPPKRRWFARRR